MKPGMWRRLLATPAIVGGSLVVLLSAVVLGVSFSALRLFPPFGGRPQLGRALERSGFAPLTDRFVNQVLGPGEALVDQRAFRSLVDQRAERVGSRELPSVGGAEPPGLDIVHPFTNNDQADAYPVNGLPFTGRTSTAVANREPGEPECGPQVGGTAWYRYTASRNDSLLADTIGTGYQTTLAAYRQSASGPIALENACDFDPQGNSQIKFDVSSGTTYLLQVGAAVRGGDLIFHLARFGDKTTLASVSTTGEPANAPSKESSVSFDGRYVAFVSLATNLIAGKHSGSYARNCIACLNVFLRDRQSGTTRLVSEALDGRGGNHDSHHPQVSDDGRYVVFDSLASNLVQGDTNYTPDIFLRDLRNGHTERVSLTDRGEQIGPSIVGSLWPPWGRGAFLPSMSGDGRYVAFLSRSPNVVQDDDDESYDVFVRDRQSKTTRMVSLDNEGRQTGEEVWPESISRDGRWIVLSTSAPLTEPDRDLSRDVFVRDLRTGATELVSVPEPGHELEGIRDTAAAAYHFTQRSISDDGRFVVFGADGGLVDGDTNGILDVFVRDRVKQTTERVSVSSSGGEGSGTTTTDPINSGSLVDWSISGDGRTVAFSTDLNSLESDDVNRANDVYLRDRIRGVTLRVSASGDVAGGYSPAISGDGMSTTFFGNYPLSYRDTNRFNDVFLFSLLPAPEWTRSGASCISGQGGCVPAVTANSSVPTARCSPNSEYETVGVGGAHEDVTPSPAPWLTNIGAFPADETDYDERSVVRFKYRIDVSQADSAPGARTADVRIALSWHSDYYGYTDYYDDYDLYVYDANGKLLAYAFNPNGSSIFEPDAGTTGPREVALIQQLPHCSDLRVEIVNNQGLPVKRMALDTTLHGLE